MPLLRHRVEDGLAARGLARSRDARERLGAELDIIERKRLSGYFIAVAGITDMIREMGIRCAIRGSGAGSLVNYLIGIGEVNPLDHGLLMERFLSEGPHRAARHRHGRGVRAPARLLPERSSTGTASRGSPACP